MKLNRPLQMQKQLQLQILGQRQRRPPKKKNQAAATLRSRTAGTQAESPCRAIHKFNGKFNCNGVVLDFSSHAAYYVVYCDVADGVLGAVYYCQAAQIVFVEKFEDVFVVRVGSYREQWFEG
jgi:hypothetical protein